MSKLTNETYQEQLEQILTIFKEDGCIVEKDPEPEPSHSDEIWYANKGEEEWGKSSSIDIAWVEMPKSNLNDEYSGWQVNFWLHGIYETEKETEEINRLRGKLESLDFPIGYDLEPAKAKA